MATSPGIESEGSDLDDERAIQRLMARNCHLVDDGAFDELTQLWPGDAELALRGETATGPVAIEAVIADLQSPELRIVLGHVPSAGFLKRATVCSSPFGGHPHERGNCILIFESIVAHDAPLRP